MSLTESLPLVSPADIPVELLPYIHEFDLPTGAKIRRMTAREHGLVGWAVALNTYQFLYADGTTGPRPTYRAEEELGSAAGDAALQALQAHYSRLAVMDLGTAWQVAREHGAGNRHAIVGERVTHRHSGSESIIVDDGRNDGGQYVRVRTEGDTVERTYPLSALLLADEGGSDSIT